MWGAFEAARPALAAVGVHWVKQKVQVPYWELRDHIESTRGVLRVLEAYGEHRD